MTFVTMVVPCYNEEKRLDVEQLVAYCPQDLRLEFLFVNDGSRDRTLEVLEAMKRRAPDRIDVLDLQPNRGKAEAVRHGFLQALQRSPDFIGFWDADLATPLDEIPRFCDVVRSRPEIDLVFGSRVKLLGRTIERKAHRHYFGRVFATAVSMTLHLPIYDSQCGAKLFRTSPTLREVFSQPFMSRWIFDVEILARFRNAYQKAGIDLAQRVYELPLTEWRDVKGSKVTFRDAGRAFVDLVKIHGQYRDGG